MKSVKLNDVIGCLDTIAAATAKHNPGRLLESRFENHPLWFGFAIAYAFDLVGHPGWKQWAHNIISELISRGLVFYETDVLMSMPHLGDVKVARLSYM